jgi:hypothetical protein
VVLVYLAYSANIPRFVSEVEKENIYSNAYQLSEILVNNPGQPSKWNDINDINFKRIGLSDENLNKSNLISYVKVKELASKVCDNNNDFRYVQDKLSMNRSFSILIFNITENGNRQQLVTCVPHTFPRAAVNATIKRITAMNNNGNIELAELIVQM